MADVGAIKLHGNLVLSYVQIGKSKVRLGIGQGCTLEPQVPYFTCENAVLDSL